SRPGGVNLLPSTSLRAGSVRRFDVAPASCRLSPRASRPRRGGRDARRTAAGTAALQRLTAIAQRRHQNQIKVKALNRACPERSRRECPTHTLSVLLSSLPEDNASCTILF